MRTAPLFSVGASRSAALSAIAALGVASCLPIDSRDPPGTVRLSVVSADEPEVVTADGWKLTIDRLLIDVGHAAFVQPCNVYSDARYDRLLDARRPAEQKISHIFASGRCYFSFSVVWPSFETLLGDGVTAGDVERMKWMSVPVPGSSAPPQRGAPIHLEATAIRGGTTKRIHWTLRQTSSYRNCGALDEMSQTKPLDLKSEADFAVRLGARGAVVFQDDPDSALAALRFDPIALADDMFGDGDGDVTLAELAKVTMDTARGFGPYRQSSDDQVARTLEAYIHLQLLPRLFQLPAGFACR